MFTLSIVGHEGGVWGRAGVMHGGSCVGQSRGAVWGCTWERAWDKDAWGSMRCFLMVTVHVFISHAAVQAGNMFSSKLAELTSV